MLMCGHLPCSWLESHLSLSQCFLMQLQGWDGMAPPSNPLPISPPFLVPPLRTVYPKAKGRTADSSSAPFTPLFGRSHTGQENQEFPRIAQQLKRGKNPSRGDWWGKRRTNGLWGGTRSRTEAETARFRKQSRGFRKQSRGLKDRPKEAGDTSL